MPSFKDPMTWAVAPQICEQWQRHVAPQLGIDVEKLMLGDVLSTIIGDDPELLIWVGKLSFDPERASLNRDQLMFRLDWELQVPELPDEVRENLEAVKQDLEADEYADWTVQENFLRARAVWQSFRTTTEAIVEEDPDYQAAVIYHDHMWEKRLREPYKVFLLGD